VAKKYYLEYKDLLEIWGDLKRAEGAPSQAKGEPRLTSQPSSSGTAALASELGTSEIHAGRLSVDVESEPKGDLMISHRCQCSDETSTDSSSVPVLPGLELALREARGKVEGESG